MTTMTGQRNWVQLSPADAKRHPLYGLEGWLVVWLAYLIVTIALTILSIADPAQRLRLDQHYHQHASLVMSLHVIILIALIATFVLGVLRDRRFPAVAVATLSADIALNIVLATYLYLMGSQAVRVFAIVSILLSTAVRGLMIGYIVLSRRINVTYLGRIRATE